MVFNFHSIAYSENSKENKKQFAQNHGYLVRALPEDNGWSIWTHKK